MLLWFALALLVAVVWAAGFAFPEIVSLTIRLIVTVIALLVVGIVLAYRKLRAARAARALEAELIKQAEQQAASARPDRRAEILELSQQIKKGLAALKTSKLAAGGAEALYALPWYVIIGPPGSGKTTALRHSGLVFPALDAGGGASIKGVGGTRNCDWWFTNEAILLDTAGRYTTQDDDREEWLAFLDLLLRHRSHKPINGILVAVSAADLIGASEEQVEAMGKTLRARVDEVMTRLQMVVPVYVLVTKVDLVAGFVEFWEDLKKSERGQIWGFTVPLLGAEAREARPTFEGEFDALVDRLHGKALRRVGETRQPETRAKCLQFPLEFQGMKDPLGDLLATLFQKNAFQETPIFRGAYFTSGTQEGRPLDRVLGGMSRAFGLRLPETSAAPAADPKSYFLTDVFRRVVFPDQHVAARTRAEARRRKLGRIGVLAASLILATVLTAPAAISFSKNRALVGSTAEMAKTAATIDWNAAKGTPSKELAKLDPLLHRLRKLDLWAGRSPLCAQPDFAQKEPARSELLCHPEPVVDDFRSHAWGLYAGETIRPSAQRQLAGQLQKGYALPVLAALEQRLRSIETGARTPDQINRHYDHLKAYLMLTEREHLDVEWATRRTTALWAQQLGVDNPKEEAALAAYVEWYQDLVKRGEIEPLPRNQALVLAARTELLRDPPVLRLYEMLVRDANAEVAAIRRETIFFGASGAFVRGKRNVKVDGAYTKLGWQRVRALLREKRKNLTAEGWVLAVSELKEMAPEDIDKQIDRLRQTYFERYLAAWQDFLLDLEVTPPENAAKALDQLLALSEPEWPYLRLIRTVHENVALDVSDEDAVVVPQGFADFAKKELDRAMSDRAKQALSAAASSGLPVPSLPTQKPISPMERAFKPLTSFAIPPAPPKPDEAPPPTGLSQYQGTLKKLVGLLTDLRDAKPGSDTKPAADEFQTAFRTTSELLSTQDTFTRPLLTPLLLEPITLAWSGVVKDASGATGGLWELEVWRFWSTKMESRYPFVDSAQNDVPMEDFNEFFKPQGGVLWKFFDTHLKGSLEEQAGTFSPSRRFKATADYGEPLLTFLSRSRKVSNAAFPTQAGGDAKGPQVAFEINVHSVSPDVSEVSLEIDGAAHTYKNTPEEWTTVQWPAKEPKARGAKVHVRGISGLDEEINRSGDFGLFRLLDAAEIKGGARARGAAPLFTAQWKLRSQKGAFVTLQIRPSKGESPFPKGFFTNLRAPRVITHGGK